MIHTQCLIAVTSHHQYSIIYYVFIQVSCLRLSLKITTIILLVLLFSLPLSGNLAQNPLNLNSESLSQSPFFVVSQACMAESKMEEAAAEDNGVPENVTFLYKFTAGACPKSYGFNAARLAGVPAHITRRGYECAKTLEAECNLRKTFQSIFRREFDAGHIRQLINSLQLLNTWYLTYRDRQ